MKNRTKALILLLFVLILIMIFAKIGLNSNEATKAVPFTVYNPNEDGYSLIYDTLEILDYPVGISHEKIDPNTDYNDVQVVVAPYEKYFGVEEMESLIQWVNLGGNLVFMEYDNIDIDSQLGSSPVYTENNFRYYEYGDGHVLVGNYGTLKNSTLVDERYYGELFIEALATIEYDDIIFNEYYHGIQDEPTLLNDMPTWLKLVIYQLALVIILLIWRYGKRFGKPVPYYEEIEREENEHVKSLALIFRNAGMGEVILENHYDAFIEYSAKYFGKTPSFTSNNITELWKEKNMPHLNELVYVKNIIDQKQKLSIKGRSKREYNNAIKKINLLTDCVKEQYKKDYF